MDRIDGSVLMFLKLTLQLKLNIQASPRGQNNKEHEDTQIPLGLQLVSPIFLITNKIDTYF